MDKEGFGFGIVWNIFGYVSLGNVVISIYHWDFLQVVLCAVQYCSSSSVYLSFDQVKDL